MNSNEPEAAPANFAAHQQLQASAKTSSELDRAERWQNRRTVVRQVSLGSSLAGGSTRHNWNPNLFRLSFQGTLSLLRGEAFRVRTAGQTNEEAETAQAQSKKSGNLNKQYRPLKDLVKRTMLSL